MLWQMHLIKQVQKGASRSKEKDLKSTHVCTTKLKQNNSFVDIKKGTEMSELLTIYQSIICKKRHLHLACALPRAV